MSVPLGVENATKTFIAAREGLDGSLLEKLLYDPSSNVRLIVFRKLPVMISALMPGTEVPPAMKTGVNERPTPRPSRRPIGCLLLSAHHGAPLRPSRSHVPPVHSVRAHQSAPQRPQLASTPRVALYAALPRLHPQDARKVCRGPPRAAMGRRAGRLHLDGAQRDGQDRAPDRLAARLPSHRLGREEPVRPVRREGPLHV